MREEIIAKIDNELMAERLLFEDRDNYTETEQQLMVDVIKKRLEEDAMYYYYGYGYFKKLVDTCKNINLTIQENGVIILSAETENLNPSNHETKEDCLDYASFICNEKYGASLRDNFTYPKMIKNNIWTASKVNSIKRGYIDFLQDDINFIVTHNFFFDRYPEFFDDDYVECLEILTSKRKILLPKEEKKELKKAIKILENNINEYKETKGLNVKKKSLFQKIIKK